MAKGWENVRNNAITVEKITKAERTAKDRAFSKLIRNTNSLKAFDLKAESEALYEKKINEENKLLDAFNRKAVKSKEAIKQAIRIKKERTENTENVTKEPVTEA